MSLFRTRQAQVVGLIFLVHFIIFLIVFCSSQQFGSNVITRSPFAYITFTNSDNYAQGVMALAMSLSSVYSSYPLVVMVTKEVTSSARTVLKNIGCILIDVEPIELPESLNIEAKRWGPAFSKLLAWKMEEYAKLIFLDSDLLILQNIDELFQLPSSLFATVDADASSCEYKEHRLRMINSGVLAITPHLPTFNKMISVLHNKTLLSKGPMNDQDVITHSMEWEGLPYPQYGAQITHCICIKEQRLWDYTKIKLIHFTAGLSKLPKPWEYKENDNPSLPQCLKQYYKSWQGMYAKAKTKAKMKISPNKKNV